MLKEAGVNFKVKEWLKKIKENKPMESISLYMDDPKHHYLPFLPK